MNEEFWKQLNVPTVIAKDECLYCFETAYNDTASDNAKLHSLDLCLSCFQTVCQRHLPLHAKASEQTQDTVHSTYLNIWKIKKAEDPDDRSVDQANKKIKLNVVDKSDEDYYDTKWSLFEYNMSTSSQEHSFSDSDTEAPALVTEKIAQILGSKSQDLVDKTTSWELTVNTCPHTLEFEVADSEPKAVSENCNDCQLAQNLWLCLHCGNVGCGREQVGIEGHSHALKHFESNPSHSLSVKLGSLTQSSADLYCYSCNDEVKFPDITQLARSLAKLGIDLDSKRASEKTLVELQVQQNMSWDFQMTDSQGHDLKRLSAGHENGCGLINLGNSCYLNSVLQCLLNGGVKNYSWNELGQSFPPDVLYPGTNLLCQLIKLNNAIRFEPELYADGIRPRSFKKCIGQGHEEFASDRQQDALEFLTYLIDRLDQKIFPKTTANPNDRMKFVMEDRLQCNTCGKVRYTTEPCKALQVPLKESQDPDTTQDLVERLQAYFRGEELQFRCPNCQELTTATRTPGFQNFPGTLVLNPVRLKLVNWTPVKTSDDLAVPGLRSLHETLDISPFQSRGFDPASETLLPDSDSNAAQGFVPEPTCLSLLTDMGFSANAAAKALHATGNLETEPALNWLFEHAADPGLNDPMGTASTPAADMRFALLPDMVSMGLDPKLCRKALILNDGDLSRSVAWVFSHLDDDGELPPEQSASATGNAQKENPHNHDRPAPPLYRLAAVVCHKGNSAHSGHYVAFIRKEVDKEERWVLYNDEKIVVATEENLCEIGKNGFLYFYSRI